MRGDRLGEPFADETTFAEHGDRAALERRFGRVLQAYRFEGEGRVASLALRIIEVNDFAGGFRVEDRDHRRRALRDRHRRGGLEMGGSDRFECLRPRGPRIRSTPPAPPPGPPPPPTPS